MSNSAEGRGLGSQGFGVLGSARLSSFFEKNLVLSVFIHESGLVVVLTPKCVEVFPGCMDFVK